MDHSNTTESKFSFLFEPIKDLAINFNIDLNHHLKHYLNQLESIDASVKNASNSINFVEAALILRGSAAVYSKKVDYLYSLTVKILEMLTEDKQKQKSKINNEEMDKDNDVSDIEEMSMLDNIEVSKNLSCKDEINEVSLSTVLPLSLKNISNHHNNNKQDDASREKNFMMNTCKIFNSMLLLNRSEMTSLMSTVKCHDTCETRIGGSSNPDSIRNVHSFNGDNFVDMNDYEPDYLIATFSGNSHLSESYIVIFCREFISSHVHGLKTEIQMDVEMGEIIEGFPVHVNTNEECVEDDKTCKLLDPYENEHKKFIKNAKKGRTFKLPESLSQKKKTKITPIGFIEKSDHKSRVTQLEREFEDMLIIKKPVKAKRSCKNIRAGQENYEKLQDYHTAADDDDDDDTDAIYTPDDFDIVNASNHGQLTDPQNNFQENDYAVMDVRMTEFFKKADSYKIINDLSEKILEWESKIMPVLEYEERAEPFDINKHSIELLHKLESVGGKASPVAFCELVACGDNNKDVCKTFMSVLHLVNQLKIEINNHTEMNYFQLGLI